jgi:hypothetical protein
VAVVVAAAVGEVAETVATSVVTSVVDEAVAAIAVIVATVAIVGSSVADVVVDAVIVIVATSAEDEDAVLVAMLPPFPSTTNLLSPAWEESKPTNTRHNTAPTTFLRPIHHHRLCTM